VRLSPRLPAILAILAATNLASPGTAPAAADAAGPTAGTDLAVGGVTVAAAAAADTGRAFDPERARQRVAAAREAAGGDRHEEAAGAFLDALASDGRLVAVVADELAYQKLWREDAEKAVFYFRRYLARHPDQPSRDARKGLALALSWSGRQGDAVALYRELLAEDPADAAVRLGLGRALIWDNRLHAGHEVLRALEVDPDADPGARRGAGQFLLTVLDGYDPHLDLRWNASWDSDDLDIHRLGVRGRTNLASALLEAAVRQSWYRQPGQPDAAAQRLGLGAVVPLHHRWTLHAYGWLDRVGSDGPVTFTGADLDWTRPGGDAWLTWVATSRLRLDLGAASQPVETYQALSDELHHELVNLSAEWRLARAWTLAGGGQVASYSDGNGRTRGTLLLQWRREGTWELRAGPSFWYMDYEDAYPGGYWAPAWVRNGSLRVLVARRWDRLVARLDGSLGLERELGGDAVTVGGVHGQLGWRLAGGWLLQADLGYSRSRFATASGYSRTFAGLAVRALF